MTGRVLSAGILVADIFPPPLDRLPASGELVSTDDFLVQPGGCAANTAIVLAKLGIASSVVGRVGEDLFGELVERFLRDRGIDTAGVLRTPGLGTSKTVALSVVGDDRRFIHTFGANAALTAADLPDPEGADVLYLGGYLVLPGVRQAELAARFGQARARGTSVLLDVVVPSDRGLSLDDLRDLLPLADYFLPNEDEARALTGESDPGAQAERIVEAGARTVIVKRGAQGAFVRGADKAFEVPAPPIDAIDPSGAGDAFAAGLIVGLLEGWPLERTVRYASAVGGSACRALGCHEGAFTRAEADAFVAEWAAGGRV